MAGLYFDSNIIRFGSMIIPKILFSKEKNKITDLPFRNSGCRAQKSVL